MSNLTEHEIFDLLRTTLRSAVQHTKNLALLPAQGPTYRLLIEELKTIENCSRQVQFFRRDMRWGAFANEMERFHVRIGDAIRHRNARAIFLEMARGMEFVLARADELRTARTGRREGPILPKIQPGPHRETRPVHVSQGGIILPGAA